MFLSVKIASIWMCLFRCSHAFLFKVAPHHIKGSPSETALSALQRDWVSPSDKVKELRRLLFESDELTIMPCCYDGLTARLVEQAGFQLTFMTGFGVSSTYGLPDTGT